MTEADRRRKRSRQEEREDSNDESEYEPEDDIPPKKRRKVDDSDSDFEPEKASKKTSKRNAAPKAKAKAKKSKPRGLTKKAANEFKKKMNGFVKVLAKMVNRDWHDGYEEQGEQLQEYFQYLKEPAMCVYEYVVKGRDYDKLNEILKNMADTWDNIHAIPFRGGVEMGDTDFDLELTEIGVSKNFYASPSTLISFMWCLMLHGACANDDVTDEEIHRYIKDAVDNDVDVLGGCDDDDDGGGGGADEDEEKETKEGVIEQHECLRNGGERLKSLLENKQVWNALASTKKKHKMRRGIDRRFDGDLSMRTRDYHLYDDDFF